MSNILVVGSSNTDIIMKVPQLPRPGETVIGTELQVVQGGKGANQAVAAARMGAETLFLASVGNDDFGGQAISGYQKDGINTNYIKRVDKPTGIALIHISDEGENSIAINAGANGELMPEDVQESLFAGINFLIVQLEVPLPTIIKAVEVATKMGVKVIFNPAPAMDLPGFPFDKVFLFTPNETEAEFYTGITIDSIADAKQATQKLKGMGIENVIITLGKKGAYCSVGEFEELVEGFSVTAMDTTAAGDVFNGALAVGLTRFDHIRDAIRFAHGASALAVQKLGAQPSIPSLKEVELFIS